MVGDDREMVTKQVLVPFSYHHGDGTEFVHICRRSQKIGSEGLAKKGNGVALLRQDDIHSDPGRVCLKSERFVEVW